MVEISSCPISEMFRNVTIPVMHGSILPVTMPPLPPRAVVELWDSNSHVTQEHMEREWEESKLGDRDCQSCQRLPCLQFTVIKLC